MVDTDSLQAQLADAMGSYMNEMMGQYGASVGQAIENQMASVMEQMMTQISAGIQQYMQQAMAQLAQNLGGAMNLSPEAFEQAFQVNMDGRNWRRSCCPWVPSRMRLTRGICRAWVTRIQMCRRKLIFIRRILRVKSR